MSAVLDRPSKDDIYRAFHKVMKSPAIGMKKIDTLEDFPRSLEFKARSVDSVSLADALTQTKEDLAEVYGWDDVPARLITDEEFLGIIDVGNAVDVMEMSLDRYLRGELLPQDEDDE